MADQKVTELPIKNQSAINVADYLFGIDAAEGYQMLISDLAKKIIEDFTGSTLGGSSQALKTIIDAINTKIGNTAMGTTATTITGAIKEHETDISTLNGKTTTAFKILPYNKAYTINANSALTLSANDFDVSAPTGYTPVGIVQFTSGNGDVYVRAVNAAATGTSGMLYLKNISSSSISVTAYMQILYVKTSLM